MNYGKFKCFERTVSLNLRWEDMGFIEYVRTATSETVTDNSLGNLSGDEKFSARNEKLHITSIFSIRLTEWKFSSQADNIHIISPLDIWLGSQYASANFYEYKNHILTLTIFLETITLNTITFNKKPY